MVRSPIPPKHGAAMPATPLSSYVLPILLLIGSNVFMTLAWYGHLRFKEVPLAGVIVVSWLIASVEYCMAVPAEPLGQRGLYHGAAQDHTGGGHAADLRRLLRALSQGAHDLELRGRFCLRCDGGVLRLSRAFVTVF